jgi:hypothetical protein
MKISFLKHSIWESWAVIIWGMEFTTRSKNTTYVVGTMILVIILLVTCLLIGKLGFAPHQQTTTSTSSVQNADSPPTIPPTGAYLGAWVNPLSLSNTEASSSNEIPQLAAFDSAIGRAPTILLIYKGFTDPLPISSLNSIIQNGSTPLLSWSCTNVTDVSSGKDDSLITAYAQALKKFGHPIFMRWYWEMNLAHDSQSGCNAYQNGPGFTAAWIHIWNIFHLVGASNVAFVWAPSGSKNTTDYYPGDQYVDWIAIDSYQHESNGSPTPFATIFQPFYQEWSTHGKPLMISETGALPNNQVSYLQQIGQDLPTEFPDIKAVMYFDSAGNKGPWTLSAAGLGAFKVLAANPYFSVKP